MNNYRQKVIAGFTFIGGLYFFLEFLLPKQMFVGTPLEFQFGLYSPQIIDAIRAMGAMAIGLGVINILRVHGSRLIKTQKGWSNSLALIFGFFAVLFLEGADFLSSEHQVGSWKEIEAFELFVQRVFQDQTEKGIPGAPRIKSLVDALLRIENEAREAKGFFGPNEAHAEETSEFLKLLATSKSNSHSLLLMYESEAEGQMTAIGEATAQTAADFKRLTEAARTLSFLNYENGKLKKYSGLINRGLFDALGSAMFSLLAFYIASAAYRSFRAKTMEATVMMLIAVVVMLGQIPHGPLYIYSELPAVRLWILNNINVPAFRAIYFGSAIAGLAMATRMWLSLEKSPLSVDDSESGAATEGRKQ